MSDNTTIADILDDGADRIEKYGWYNPRLPEYRHAAASVRVCALTSIGETAEVFKREWARSIDALARYVGVSLQPGGLPGWNDSHDNPQPVLDAMRGCAKELRRMDDSGL